MLFFKVDTLQNFTLVVPFKTQPYFFTNAKKFSIFINLILLLFLIICAFPSNKAAKSANAFMTAYIRMNIYIYICSCIGLR